MGKALLRGRLQTIKNNYALVQAGIALLVEPDALPRFERTFGLLKDHPETITFAYIGYVFKTHELLKHATQELRNSVLRNCLKETFELVKSYGTASSQAELIRSAPWYHFLRLVRNSASHDLHLRFRQFDFKYLPITWSGLTIDSSMDNIPLQRPDFLSRAKIIELLDDVIDFVEDELA